MSESSTKILPGGLSDLGERYLEIVRSRRGHVGGPARRKTLRKELIAQGLSSFGINCCMLFEELRWHVFRLEQLLKDRVQTKMTRSYRNSFNRTIRSLSGSERLIRYAALAEPGHVSAGLVARAATFRVGDSRILDELFSQDALAIHLARETETRVGRAEYEGEWIPISNIRVGFAAQSLTRLSGVFYYSVRIPVNRLLRVVTLSQLNLANVTQLGLLPKRWSLVLDGYEQPCRIEWYHCPNWTCMEIEQRYRCRFDRSIVRHGRLRHENFDSPPRWPTRSKT